MKPYKNADNPKELEYKYWCNLCNGSIYGKITYLYKEGEKYDIVIRYYKFFRYRHHKPNFVSEAYYISRDTGRVVAMKRDIDRRGVVTLKGAEAVKNIGARVAKDMFDDRNRKLNRAEFQEG